MPSTTSDYEDLFEALVGFGGDTTVALMVESVIVTRLADAGEGTLRQCVESASGSMWIRFDVDGTLELTTDISLPDNITIDGREHDVQITGGGLRSSSVKMSSLRI